MNCTKQDRTGAALGLEDLCKLYTLIIMFSLWKLFLILDSILVSAGPICGLLTFFFFFFVCCMLLDGLTFQCWRKQQNIKKIPSTLYKVRFFYIKMFCKVWEVPTYPLTNLLLNDCIFGYHILLTVFFYNALLQWWDTRWRSATALDR